MRIPANPKDFVNDRSIIKLSYFFIMYKIDSLWFGTNSIKHSSTKTKEFFFFANKIIFFKFFLEIKQPVGLLGLQIKIQPFVGILEIKSSMSFSKSIVLK